ncbi:hypothetical protein D3C71_1689000 [compost metagenome]
MVKEDDNAAFQDGIDGIREIILDVSRLGRYPVVRKKALNHFRRNRCRRSDFMCNQILQRFLHVIGLFVLDQRVKINGECLIFQGRTIAPGNYGEVIAVLKCILNPFQIILQTR